MTLLAQEATYIGRTSAVGGLSLDAALRRWERVCVKAGWQPEQGAGLVREAWESFVDAERLDASGAGDPAAGLTAGDVL